MADGPALALQAAIIAALRADAAVSALVGARVYDEPPQGVEFPYIRLGEFIAQPFHTDGKAAFEITYGVEAYSRPKSGRVEATRIAFAIQAALHDQNLTVAGYSTAWNFCETFTTSREADGREYSSVVAFTAMLDV